MAQIGELSILLSLKGVNSVRTDLESTRKQVDTFGTSLKNLRTGLTGMSRDLRAVQIAAQTFAIAISGPLLLSLNVASKSNRDLSLAMKEVTTASQEVMRSIGSSLLPVVQDIGANVKEFANRWKELSKSERDSIVQTAAWTATALTTIAVAARFLRAFIGIAKAFATPSGIVALGFIGIITLLDKLADKITGVSGKLLSLEQRFKRIALLVAMTPLGRIVAGVAAGAGAAMGGAGLGGSLKAAGHAFVSPEDAMMQGGGVNLGSIHTSGAKQAGGISQAFQGVRDELHKTKDEIDRVFGELNTSLPTFAQTIASALKTTFETFTQGMGDAVAQSIVFGQNFGESVKTLMKNIAASVIAFLVGTIAKVVILRALGVVGPIWAGALGLGGGGSGGEGGDSSSGGGGGFFSGVKKLLGFAEGGIVTKPTLGVFGEAGPEAVVPLDKMSQMGGGVTLNFHGHTFFNDQSSIDYFVRKISDGMKRATNRRTGGTSIAF